MPHVSLVAFSGLRVCSAELAELGMQLPGLTARAAAVQQLPSLGLLTLAGMLPEGWTCSYREGDGGEDALIEALVGERPTVVAMSALTASVERAYGVADRLRRENLRTALGGLHATVCADEATLHVDAVCQGEGELVWQALLDDAVKGTLRPKYEAVRTEAPLPWALPRFELLAGRPGPRWTLQTQRGCPLACEFCAASRLISRFREKPVAQIRRELDAIARITPHPVLELADDNTFAGDREPAPLLDALDAAGAHYFTEVDWRVGERPELLAAMARSGCVQVLIGIESLVFRFPGMGAKEASLARIMAAIERIQEAGIAVNGCFIVGGDGETDESIERMIEFILASQLADVQVTLSTPFPGTVLRARLARQGRLLAERNWSHCTLFDATFRPDRMSVEDLEAGFRRVLGAVYDAGEAKRRASIRREIWRHNPSMRGKAWPA